MKKLIGILLAAAMLLSLCAACGNNETQPSQSSAPVTE